MSNILIQCEEHLLYFDRIGSCVVTEASQSLQTKHLIIVNKYFEANKNDIIKSFSNEIDDSILSVQWELDFNLSAFYKQFSKKFMNLLDRMKINDINYHYFKLFYDNKVKCNDNIINNFRIGTDLEPHLITYGNV